MRICLMPVPPASAAECPTGIVNTTSGRVCGKVKIFQGRTINSFLGIACAETTAGENRWRHPIPMRPGSRVLRAASFNPACPQKIGDEVGKGNYCTLRWRRRQYFGVGSFVLSVENGGVQTLPFKTLGLAIWTFCKRNSTTCMDNDVDD